MSRMIQHTAVTQRTRLTHVGLNQVDPDTFFGVPELLQPLADQEPLSNIAASAMQQDPPHAELIAYLDFAVIPEKGETPVDDFVVSSSSFWIVFVKSTRGRTFRFLFAAKTGTQTDVCIIDRSQNDILLLVQEDNRLELMRDGERLGSLWRRRQVVSRVIPGIVMVGTSPAFFKIPVTQTLSIHIRHGTYPEEGTSVTYCYPPASCPIRGHRRTERANPMSSMWHANAQQRMIAARYSTTSRKSFARKIIQ
ncbi:hypothetical protein BS47DRAFT_1399672 [Hydnum rufescens UP504]|uniref:Uncharacterized protein n=1 Tax=Hydnum rufescens UP504 TaxID=1448309 RepID=A0A9P6DKJ9_9AGAM|nr:hypothetical protein BS47DRAFT_1399672 [Hydnum rufescens UP504]